VLASPASRKFICANGAEGEPGTFKDRDLLQMNPYLVIEGLAIGAAVIGAERAFLCLNHTCTPAIAAVERALAECRSTTSMSDRIEVVLGPDEYLFGRGEGAPGSCDSGAIALAVRDTWRQRRWCVISSTGGGRSGSEIMYGCG
jgi:hypothetical protein